MHIENVAIQRGGVLLVEGETAVWENLSGPKHNLCSQRPRESRPGPLEQSA